MYNFEELTTAVFWSMLRFAMISSHREQFQDMDFIFCIDVDVIFKDQVD